MMNTVVGSAIGGLVAGAVALGAAAAMRPSPAPAYGPDPNANGAYAMTVANTAALNNGVTTMSGAFTKIEPYRSGFGDPYTIRTEHEFTNLSHTQ